MIEKLGTKKENLKNPAEAGFWSGLPIASKLGVVILLIALVILGIWFYPAVSKELWFHFVKPDSTAQVSVGEPIRDFDPRKKYITPVDLDFSIVIPKIGANTKVFKDVDSTDSAVYQQVLTQGVAHAKGTSLPDQGGNTFIFAHSSDNFYNANRYNAVFYLLNKLEVGDKIYLVYEGQKFTYEVSETKLVDPSEISYMENKAGSDQVTLMTCWPAGTTLKRLVVIGKNIQQ